VTYVITQPCIGEKNGACVDVCPAACIHTTPDAPQNYIDPDICIECEQCVLVCPVNAIFLDSEVPDEWRPFVEVNAAFFEQHKAANVLGPDRVARMLEAIRAFAARATIAVAAVVVDRDGQALASVGVDGTDPSALASAERKAYTALKYGVATHELRPGGGNAWPEHAEIDPARVLMVGGGFPLVDTGDTLGAVGVAGGASPEQDILCCQAALGALDTREERIASDALA
jgi:ferredoxin